MGTPLFLILITCGLVNRGWSNKDAHAALKKPECTLKACMWSKCGQNLQAKITSQILKHETDRQFKARMPQIDDGLSKLIAQPTNEVLTQLQMSMVLERVRLVMKEIQDLKANASKKFLKEHENTIASWDSRLSVCIKSLFVRAANGFWEAMSEHTRMLTMANGTKVEMPQISYELEVAMNPISNATIKHGLGERASTTYNDQAHNRKLLWESMSRLTADTGSDQFDPVADYLLVLAGKTSEMCDDSSRDDIISDGDESLAGMGSDNVDVAAKAQPGAAQDVKHADSQKVVVGASHHRHCHHHHHHCHH